MKMGFSFRTLSSNPIHITRTGTRPQNEYEAFDTKKKAH